MAGIDTQHSSLGMRKKTLVETWDAICTCIIQELDADQVVLNECLAHSQRVLGTVNVATIRDGASFFESLRNNMASEDDILDYLIGLMQWLNYHMHSGTLSVQNLLQEQKQKWYAFRQDCARRRISKDIDFVGRINDIDVITEALMDRRGTYKGVCICGLGGLGKTSLANEVCFRLINSDTRWNVIKIDLREKSDLTDLLHDILVELKQTSRSDDFEDLQRHLFHTLQNIKDSQGILLLLDNIDDIMETNREVLIDFLENLADELDTCQSNIRMIITVRQKLIPEKEIVQKLIRFSHKDSRLGDLILELELKPLSEADAVDLLLKCIRRPHLKEPSVTVCYKIVHKCGYSPLAIRSLSSIIKSGFVSPDLLAQNLGEKDRQENLSQVSQCLRQTFQTLDPESREQLMRLSVCNTIKFGIDVAADLLEEPRFSEGQIIGILTKLDLLHLKSRHLIEIDSTEHNQEKPIKTLQSNIEYSIHPLVNDFLKQMAQSKREEFERLVTCAKLKYVEHFEEMVNKVAEKQDRNFMGAHKIFQNNKVHIQNFFNILLDLPAGGHTRQTGFSRIVSCRRMSDVADLIVYDHVKFSLLKKWITDAERNQNLTECAYWKTMEAKKFLDSDRSELAMEKLDYVEKELFPQIFETELVWSAVLGTFYYIKGSALLSENRPLDAKANLKTAEKYLKRIKSHFTVELTDTINSIGCAYYNWQPEPNYKKAEEYHLQAFKELSRKVENFYNIQLTDIITNIGRTIYMQGIELEKRGERESAVKLYQKSVSYFSYAIKLDREFDIHKFESHAHKLLVRCDAYCRLCWFDEAEADVKKCFELRRRNIRPPHWKITITNHRRGEVMMGKGIVAYKEGQKSDALYMLYEAIADYEHTMHLLKLGGLSIHHKEFQNIKDNHRWLLLQTKDKKKLDEMVVFYAQLESGVFENNYRRSRSEKETVRPTLTQKELNALINSGRLHMEPLGQGDDSDIDGFYDDGDNLQDQVDVNMVKFNDLKTKLNFNFIFRTFKDANEKRKHFDLDDDEDEFIDDIYFTDSTRISDEMPKDLKPDVKEDEMDIDEENINDEEKVSIKDVEDQVKMNTIQRKTSSLSISSQTSVDSNASDSDVFIKRSRYKHKGSRGSSLQSFLEELEDSAKEARARFKSSASSSIESSFDEPEENQLSDLQNAKSRRKLMLHQMHNIKHHESIDEEGMDFGAEVEEENKGREVNIKSHRKREHSEEENSAKVFKEN